MAFSMAKGTWKPPPPEEPEEEEIKSPTKAGSLFGIAAEKAKEDEERKKKEAEEADDEAKKLLLEKEDLERWGRYWTWENYFNEEAKGEWEEAAGRLLNINEHVLQDIEDVILLQGFNKFDQKQVTHIIDEHHTKRREYDIVLKRVEDES